MLEVGVDGHQGEHGNGGAASSLDEIENVRQGFAPLLGLLPGLREVLGDGVEDDLGAEAGETALKALEPGGHRTPPWLFSMLKV